MGGGSYSLTSRKTRAVSLGYTTKSAGEIFKSRGINNAMNPKGIKLRESRDSIEHPESLAIILALDVTGSMGSVPHYLVKEGLPHIVQNIIDGGIVHPQVLFLGVGDHEYDQAPLQVGQFESSDALLDKWLTEIWLEGHGGGNVGESYLLAWYFASKHTVIDCLEKRNKKGFLFTIGDEPCLETLPQDSVELIMGKGQYDNYTAAGLLEAAKEKYNCYHINNLDSAGDRPETKTSWKALIGSDHLLHANRHTDVVGLISRTVISASAEIDTPIITTAGL